MSMGVVAAIGIGVGAATSMKASSAQKKAYSQMTAEERRQFDLIQEQTKGQRELGQWATMSLGDMMGMETSSPYLDELDELRARASAIAPKERMSRTDEDGDQLSAADLALRVQEYDAQVAKAAPLSSADQARMKELEEKQSAFENREKYDFQKAPGYQWRLGQGMQALERSQAGRRLGGRAVKEAERYGQGFASNEYGQQFNRLSNLAGMGSQATNQTIATLPSTQPYQLAGDAAANKYGAVNQAVQSGLSNYMTWDTYNKGGNFQGNGALQSYGGGM